MISHSHLHATTLLGVLAIVAATQTVPPVNGNPYTETCGGSDADLFDLANAPVNKKQPPLANACSGQGSSAEFVQLFTPRSLPWNYTTICWKALYGDAPSITANTPYTATISAYYDNGGVPETVPFFSVEVPTTALVPPFGVVPFRWYSAQIAVVATRPRLFIGVRIAGDCTMVSYFTASQDSSRLSAWRQNPGDEWSLHMSDWSNGNDSVLLVRTRGRAVVGAPSGWSCEPGRYKDGTCDCKCGLWDPDCLRSPVSSSCDQGAGQICNSSGLCQSIDWNKNIAGCELKSYGAGDGCQCGCGRDVDPDCLNSTIAGIWNQPATNCPSSSGRLSTCDINGACVDAWTDPSCPAAALNDGKCDCECTGPGKVIDADCLRPHPANTTCGVAWHCFGGECRNYPQAWACFGGTYGTSNGCDCGCGAPDPDCTMKLGEIVSGCPVVFGKVYRCNNAGFPTCLCVDGYTPTKPPSIGCTTDSKPNSTDVGKSTQTSVNLGVIVGIPVGVTGVAIAGAVAAVAFMSVQKRKKIGNSDPC
eukprot:m51a1_g1147 putative C-tail anchored protein (532) ;mRNA; r:280301-282923